MLHIVCVNLVIVDSPFEFDNTVISYVALLIVFVGQLFVTSCRALRLCVRLVCSLQPVSFKPCDLVSLIDTSIVGLMKDKIFRIARIYSAYNSQNILKKLEYIIAQVLVLGFGT